MTWEDLERVARKGIDDLLESGWDFPPLMHLRTAVFFPMHVVRDFLKIMDPKKEKEEGGIFYGEMRDFGEEEEGEAMSIVRIEGMREYPNKAPNPYISYRFPEEAERDIAKFLTQEVPEGKTTVCSYHTHPDNTLPSYPDLQADVVKSACKEYKCPRMIWLLVPKMLLCTTEEGFVISYMFPLFVSYIVMYEIEGKIVVQGSLLHEQTYSVGSEKVVADFLITQADRKLLTHGKTDEAVSPYVVEE